MKIIFGLLGLVVIFKLVQIVGHLLHKGYTMLSYTDEETIVSTDEKFYNFDMREFTREFEKA